MKEVTYFHDQIVMSSNEPRLHDDLIAKERVTARELSETFGLPTRTIKKLAVGAIDGSEDSENGRTVLTYDAHDSINLLTDFLSIPSVDESGIYEDNQGRKFSNLSAHSKKIGLSLAHLARTVKEQGTPAIQGRRGATVFSLFSEQQISSLFDPERKSLQQVEKGKDSYEDDEGNIWMSRTKLMKNFQVTLSSKTLSGVETIQIVASNGKRTKFYRFSQAVEKIDSIRNLPKVDRESGQYIDENGAVWIVRKEYEEKLPSFYGSNRSLLEGCTFITGKDRVGKIVSLYNKTEIEEKFKTHLTLPILENNESKFVSEDDRTYVSMRHIFKNLIQDYDTIKKFARGVPQIKVRAGNKVLILYCEETLMRRLNDSGYLDRKRQRELNPKPKKESVPWAKLSKESPKKLQKLIENAARKLLAQGQEISHESFKSNGYSGCCIAVMRYYPDSFNGLRTKLGLVSVKRQMWPEKLIFEKAREFIEQHGTLTKKLLEEKGQSKLFGAICRRGLGMRKVREVLGLQELKRPDGFWTLEVIRDQALQVFLDHGKLNSTVLEANGKTTLLSAIMARYPGKMTQLRMDLEINGPKRNYWNPEKIEIAALEFYKNQGVLSYKELQKNKRNDLLWAILKHYPGGIVTLREKLAIVELDPAALLANYEEALQTGAQITFSEFIKGE